MKTVNIAIKDLAGNFTAIHRGKLTPNMATEINFQSVPLEFLIQNISESGTIYLSLEGAAVIDGENTIKIPSMTEINRIRARVNKISLISDSETEFQVIGVI